MLLNYKHKNDQSLTRSYQFSADYVPILCVCFKMLIPHKLIVFEHSDPITLYLAHLCAVALTHRRLELLHSDRVRVEVLQNDVVEEGHFGVLVELYLNVGLARLLLQSHGLVGDEGVQRDDVELRLLCWQAASASRLRLFQVLLLPQLDNVVKEWRSVNH